MSNDLSINLFFFLHTSAEKFANNCCVTFLGWRPPKPNLPIWG